MFLIAHRGNVDGPCPEFENKPEYIFGGLRGYDNIHFEVDVWYVGGELFLGHDNPQYKISESFLMEARLWCHAKNLEAFEYILKCPIIHGFWHQEDDFALTTRGYVWTYPGKPLCKHSVCVLPELCSHGFDNVAGVCSDFIGRYR